MSLTGFDHVFSEARMETFSEGLALRVIPPVVLMLLKIIAFMDDPYRRLKDLSDIRSLLSSYEADSDRIFTEAISEVSDYSLASAFLLGLDLRELCTEEELGIVSDFVAMIGNESESSWWSFVKAAPRPSGQNEETAREQLQTFSVAFWPESARDRGR